jgi:hypothetical protein
MYDVDAAPQHGVSGDLSERLGAVTADADFVDGALYVRSDNGAVVLSLRHSSDDSWLERPLVSSLLGAADWRSRTSDVRPYPAPTAPVVSIADSAVFVIQHFAVEAAAQERLSAALAAFVDRFARPIQGFLDSTILKSADGTRVVWIAGWAHEAVLIALETPDSFAAMRAFVTLAQTHVFGTFTRVSYVSRAGAALAGP